MGTRFGNLKMNKEELWNAMKSPVVERECSTCCWCVGFLNSQPKCNKQDYNGMPMIGFGCKTGLNDNRYTDHWKARE